ncbi:MAG: PEP-CTERM sorting domain-containing protein [Fimbriimonadaceae bacterium]|nr:MAG: PEP-CTERM sorting domain-containing protein [Armatimonadota bacterium]MCK6632410.1 PEP-CTERM sorting domain-containing protein [Fimbriimonadaceae bacterium]NUM38162.1 PEP-CTERM sorting domain-containing protein [Armatimonadota bacterium]GIK33152.1 MAG: hypothetical protein BroJett009_21440 [Armatimonadota bacterium]
MRTLRLFSFLAATCVVASSQAIVAFSNFGAGDSYNVSSGWSLLSGGFGSQFVSHQFVSGASGSLESIEVAFGHVDGTNDYSVSLRDDSSDAPGSYITTWSGIAAGAFGAGDPPIFLPNGFPSIVLSSGTKYWVEVKPTTDGTWGGWNFNDQGDTRLTSFNDGAPSVSDAGAFRVNVVPEPASMAALGLGAVALIRRRKSS